MKKRCITAAVVLCLTLCVKLTAQSLPGSPDLPGPSAPVAYQEISDPPDEAKRHIVVKADDRGEVWLLTGFLHGWHPDIDYELIARLKPKHWRDSAWPFWYPSWVDSGDKSKHWGGFSWRGSPAFTAKWLEMILCLRGHPMPADVGAVPAYYAIPSGSLPMTFQMLFQPEHTLVGGPPVDSSRLSDFGDRIEVLIRYAKLMGVPIDYWEVCNEPPHGPAYLATWDAGYQAIRSADPEAKIVGPSYYGTNPKMIEPFLAHCKDKGQRLDILSWHEISQALVLGESGMPVGTAEHQFVAPDRAYQNIDAIRKLVDSKYPMLNVQEIHIDEWGEGVQQTGPGTQIAFFYYLDLAGVHRAAKALWTHYDLGGILIGRLIGLQGENAPSVMSRRIYHYEYVPRASYWAWAEYAKQEGGVRLVTETNDRCVVMLASRHDEDKEMRALLARSKRDNRGRSEDKIGLPPVKVKVDFAGVPISGRAELTILKLGPADGGLWEEDLLGRTEERIVEITDGTLELTFDRVAENRVYSIRIAPPGTRAKEQAEAAKRQAQQTNQLQAKLAVSKREQHEAATRRAQQAADEGFIRISCGAVLAFVDPTGNAWFADRGYEEGSYGFSDGSTIDRGTTSVRGTDNPEPYYSELFGQTSYAITLAEGKYLLRLHFAEMYRPVGLGGRVFDIVVEGKLVFKDFDVLQETGEYDKICVKEVDVEVSDGVLNIDFPSDKNHTPLLNGIEVIR